MRGDAAFDVADIVDAELPLSTSMFEATAHYRAVLCCLLPHLVAIDAIPSAEARAHRGFRLYCADSPSQLPEAKKSKLK